MILNERGLRVSERLRSPWPEVDALIESHQLSARDVTVLVLKAAGLSVRQIADGIGIHKGTASRQIRDARRRASSNITRHVAER